MVLQNQGTHDGTGAARPPLPRHNTVTSCSLSFPPSEEQMQHFLEGGQNEINASCPAFVSSVCIPALQPDEFAL